MKGFEILIIFECFCYVVSDGTRELDQNQMTQREYTPKTNLEPNNIAVRQYDQPQFQNQNFQQPGQPFNQMQPNVQPGQPFNQMQPTDQGAFQNPPTTPVNPQFQNPQFQNPNFQQPSQPFNQMQPNVQPGQPFNQMQPTDQRAFQNPRPTPVNPQFQNQNFEPSPQSSIHPTQQQNRTPVQQIPSQPRPERNMQQPSSNYPMDGQNPNHLAPQQYPFPQFEQIPRFPYQPQFNSNIPQPPFYNSGNPQPFNRPTSFNKYIPPGLQSYTEPFNSFQNPSSNLQLENVMSQISAMLNNPSLRPTAANLLNNLENAFSNPNSFRILDQTLSKLPESMTPEKFRNGLYSGNVQSTDIQHENRASMLEDLKTNKIGAIVDFVKDLGAAKSRAIDKFFNSVPIAGDMITAGNRFADGLVNPFLNRFGGSSNTPQS